MKITCDVIQDLLLAYADGLLSEDSKTLVEEHLNTCKNCSKMLETIQKTEKLEAGSVNVLNKIKKKLLIKRIVTAVISVFLTLSIVVAAYNHWYFNETYLTIKESGIYVENNKLYSTKNLISRIRVLYVEDGKTELIYAIDAGYAGKMNLDGKKMLLQDCSIKTDESSPDDKSTPETVEKIYYLSEKAFQQIRELDKSEEEGKKNEVQKIIDEMKDNSTLVWAEH